MNSQSKILGLEALRGYMALWVFASHLLQMSGDHLSKGPFWNILANPQYAVQTFMILSGFVIALVIDRRQEPYQSFITRRIFRIYPVLLLASCAGIVLHGVWGSLIQHWWPAFFSKDTLDMFTATWKTTDQNITGYALAVLSMTNGVISERIMPHVPVAFIGVVWSLSLEFQFYLLAPWLCKVFSSKGTSLLRILSLLLLFLTFRQVLLGAAKLPTYKAFLPLSIEFFVIGILSYHLHQWCLANRSALTSLFGNNRISLLASIIVLYLLVVADQNRLLLKGHLMEVTGEWTAILIWLSTLAWMIDSELGTQGLLHRAINKLLHSKIALFIGKISYSIYLWHVPIIILVQWILFRNGHIQTWQDCLIYTSIATIPLTILVSSLSYRWIEEPFIRMGARMLKCTKASNQ